MKPLKFSFIRSKSFWNRDNFHNFDIFKCLRTETLIISPNYTAVNFNETFWDKNIFIQIIFLNSLSFLSFLSFNTYCLQRIIFNFSDNFFSKREQKQKKTYLTKHIANYERNSEIKYRQENRSKKNPFLIFSFLIKVPKILLIKIVSI